MSTSPKASSERWPARATARSLGWWSGGEIRPGTDEGIGEALRRVREPFCLVEQDDARHVALGGIARLSSQPQVRRSDDPGLPVLAHCPACPAETLGDPGFLADHGVKYALVAGAMANGIASVDLVASMARAGMLSFFGAAGLAPSVVEAAIDRLQGTIPGLPHGFNLIHSPAEQDIEAAIVDLYLRRGIRLVEASAYLDLTTHVVRYRLSGIHEDAQGRIVVPNRLIAKVSRVEVATRFLSPAPERLLRQLVAAGHLTLHQARLAERVPVAQDVTAEADSGGHTDNRPALALLPSLLALRDRLQAQHCFEAPLRVGAAGGIATPAAAAAAFAMGSAWVLTGTINQACVESGSSDAVRQMLAEAGQADVAMAPAADMFEMGVKVQVLKRGTMFAQRAAKLYELHRSFASLDDIPAHERAGLEKTIFRDSLEAVWARTRAWFLERDPRQVERAERDPKHEMALVFRSYLGLSSRWANAGEPSRRLDYQIWCGPAMGAFNEWARGSFLEQPSERRVATLARNLIHGAAVLGRVGMLRAQGLSMSPALLHIAPLADDRLQEYLQ